MGCPSHDFAGVDVGREASIMRPYQQRAEFDDPLTVNLEKGTFQWEGSSQIYRIEISLPIPDSNDKIALLNCQSGKVTSNTFRNILRCHPDGSVIWRAALPENSGDTYTRVDWSAQHLTAHSWSGFEVVLDVETGDIVSRVFTK
jgi:hypothetical protein